ncbi:MAG: FAD-dependent oxidoreductase, partial [Spirochaetales bacterium]|nr:FAD-dependent oxidoreductase [Spirochaetales bacterium]
MKYDIIIVGAGIAGLSSALHLSNSSRKILVLEKAIFPRDKPCGGGLTYKSIKLLDKIGFKYSFDDISEVNFNYYNEIINHFKRKKGILRIV